MGERRKWTKKELKALSSGTVLTDGYEHYFKGERLLTSQSGSIWTFAEVSSEKTYIYLEVVYTAEKR
jgi:hypothetical protein